MRAIANLRAFFLSRKPDETGRNRIFGLFRVGQTGRNRPVVRFRPPFGSTSNFEPETKEPAPRGRISGKWRKMAEFRAILIAKMRFIQVNQAFPASKNTSLSSVDSNGTEIHPYFLGCIDRLERPATSEPSAILARWPYASIFYLPSTRSYPHLRAVTRRLPPFPAVRTTHFAWFAVSLPSASRISQLGTRISIHLSKNNGIDAPSGRTHAQPELSGIAEAAASHRAFDPKRTAS
jgi:hypothetical protein